MDRQDWIPVGKLKVGERLQANGHTVIVLRLEEAGEEPVFNLEVDADHCYRVGEQGVLVHNASDPCAKAKITTTGPAGAVYSTQTISFEWPDGEVRDYRLTHQAVALVMLQSGGDDASTAIKNAYRMPVRFIKPRPDGTPVPPAGTRKDWFGHSNGMDTAGHIIPKIAGG